jgi:hypothetical protein
MSKIGGQMVETYQSQQVHGPLTEDIFWDDILKAVKTVNLHINDQNYNQSSLQAAFAHKGSLEKLYIEGRAEVKKMAVEYLQILDDLNKAMATSKGTVMYSQYTARQTKQVKILTPGGKPELTIWEDRVLQDEVFQVKKGILVSEERQQSHTGEDSGREILIDLGDNVVAIYRPHVSDNPWSVQGQLSLELRGFKGSAKEAQMLVEKINDLGLDGRLADETDLEIVYLARNAWMLKQDRDAEWDKIVRSDIPKTEKRNKMKEYLAQQMGVANLDTMTEYDFLPRYNTMYNPSANKQGVESGGQFYWNNFVVTDSWLKTHPIHFTHDLSCSILDFFRMALENTGYGLSTEQRWRIGVRVKGKSSDIDMRTGGANYFFMRCKKGKSSETDDLQFSGDLIKRSDHFAHSCDRYGVTVSSEKASTTKLDGSTVDQRFGSIDDRVIPTDYPNMAYEVMFKDGINLLDNLIRVNVDSESEKEELIILFQQHNITTIRGKTLDQVIKVR